MIARLPYQFVLPPRGALCANGPDDSLNYYYHPLAGWLYRARNQMTLSLLQGYFDNVLEVGYGSGVLLPSLAPGAKSLHGIDIDSDPSQVAAGLKRLGIEADLKSGDAARTDYPDEYFDLVVSVSTVQYFKDPGPFLKEASRILRPGGFLLIGMPRVDRFMDKLFAVIGFYRSGVLHHCSWRDFLAAAQTHFALVRYRRLPFWLPDGWGIYHSMLFRKN